MKINKACTAFLAATVLLGCCGCGNGGYFEEKLENPLAKKDVGGSSTLALSEGSDTLTLENGKVRIVLRTGNGAVKELVNKESKVYLTKDGEGPAVRINRINNGKETVDANHTSFSYSVAENSAEKKAVRLSWAFGSLKINSTVSLTAEADEVIFRVSAEGNEPVFEDGVPVSGLYNVEYPVINKIDTLYEKERDYLLSPFVTGYLFRNPVDNFNGTFTGISKTYGMYPSGWEYPMQFQSYFAEGIGGFQFMTKDGGDTIKSFTFTGQNGKLRTSVYHYLDDVGQTDINFDYDISIGNLTKGTWQEAADKYRDWAEKQPWVTEKGKLETRTDIDRRFFEDVALCNFEFPYARSYGEENQRKLYEMTKNRLQGGKILNIAVSPNWNAKNENDPHIALSKEYGDYFQFFDYPTITLLRDLDTYPERWGNEVKTFLSDNSSVRYVFGAGTTGIYECASCEEFRERFLEKSRGVQEKYGVDGFYYDIGPSAVHPKQCFNTAHSHGTRVNVIGEYLDQMRDIQAYAQQTSGGTHGQELVFEQMLPYCDYYQARANTGLLGWMEHDRVRPLLENGSAEKVPLFDYVYGAYGAKRTDNFITADPAIGNGYYYVTAFTALSGGIPQFNYEFYEAYEYLCPRPEGFDTARIDYVGYLYNVKKTFGKNYLVYGDMVKAPKVGSPTTETDYKLTRFEFDKTKTGKTVYDDVVVTAYRHGGKIGIFLGNVTDKSVSLKFILNAFRDYGIESGEVSFTGFDGTKPLCSIEKGKAKIDVTLGAREVVMLEIS